MEWVGLSVLAAPTCELRRQIRQMLRTLDNITALTHPLPLTRMAERPR